ALRGRGRHLEVAEGRRLRQLQGGEDPALPRGDERALGHPPLGGLEGHEVHALELVAHAPPALAGGVLDDADEEQREPAELYMRADAVLAVVEDGAQAEGALQVAPAALDLVE